MTLVLFMFGMRVDLYPTNMDHRKPQEGITAMVVVLFVSERGGSIS